MAVEPEPFPAMAPRAHTRANYRVNLVTLPAWARFGAKAYVHNPFGIRHESANDEPMRRADVSDRPIREGLRLALRAASRPRKFNLPTIHSVSFAL